MKEFLINHFSSVLSFAAGLSLVVTGSLVGRRRAGGRGPASRPRQQRTFLIILGALLILGGLLQYIALGK